MNPNTLNTLTWVLIYGGLMLVCLSIFVLRAGGAWGWVSGGLGWVMVVAGVVCVYWRSRIPDPVVSNPILPTAALGPDPLTKDPNV